MPDTRKHRGPHPEDIQLFSTEALPLLRTATGDLCWLFNRGYASTSALKLVGDRYNLTRRQRTAVGRCASSDQSIQTRRDKQIEPSLLKNRQLWLDGYNVLTTVEAALSGGVILFARDGCCRDMASMHGNYRKVLETTPALKLIGHLTDRWNVTHCRWFLDRPVSNSGRLQGMLHDVAAEAGWNWEVELVQDPDALLSGTDHVVATADSLILDRCQHWTNLARLVVEEIPDAWVIDLAGEK